MHSSEKKYYCKECNQTLKGPTYFKHMKSKKHKKNVAKFNSQLTDSTASRYYSYSNSSLAPLPVDTAKNKDDQHSTNFLRSVPQFLDMWYSRYSYDVTMDGTDVRISIHVSKVDHK